MLATIKRAWLKFRKSSAFAGFLLFLVALLLNAGLQGANTAISGGSVFSFFTGKNINTLFAKNAPFILVAVAQSLLLLAGTMDVSVGIQLALVNVVVIMTGQTWGIPFPICCVFGILAAMLASVLCWVCCSVFRLPALLASFALTYIIKGVNVLIMSVPQGKVDKLFYKAYDSQLFGVIPVSLLAIVLILLLWLYFKKTKFGTHIYAVGANPRNAFAAGINPMVVQLKAFLLKGFITGVAGVCLTLMLASGNPLQAEEYGIRSLSACIIGGLGFGGWGSVACGVFGAGFFVLIQNAVYYVFSLLVKIIPGFSVSTFWQNFVVDVIIFLGLLMTIVTAKGQREALKQGIVRQFSREAQEPLAEGSEGGANE